MSVVLAVDDDVRIRTWLTRALEPAGYVVLTAENGDRAFRILTQSPIDVMILDLNLGEQSGLDVLERVRVSEFSALPVIVLTGVMRMDEWQERTIRRHGAWVFYKPAPIDELRETLERALTHRHQ